MLKLQFAARRHYNMAENAGIGIWILCIVSAGTALLPDSFGITTIVAATIADILVLFLSLYQNKLIKKAAKFREVFDIYVLKIGDHNLSSNDWGSVFGDAREYAIKHQNKYNEQSKNNGEQRPPGVKDWYNISNCRDGLAAKFECQKENVWWDGKLMRNKLIIIAVIVCVAILLFIILLFRNPSMDRIVQSLLSSALIVRGLERLYVEIKYRDISKEIAGAIKVMNKGLCEENIIILQEMINTKRNYCVLGLNCLHRWKARELSETYQARR